MEEFLAGQPITVGNEPGDVTTEYFVEGKYVLVACALSAVTAAFLTRQLDIFKVKKFAYKTGYNAGANEVMLQMYDEFVYSEGLKHKFQEFCETHAQAG